MSTTVLEDRPGGRLGPRQGVLAATVAIGVLTVLAKGGAAFREVVVARQFGTGPEVDAFLIAFLLPSLAVGVFGSSMQSAVVPALVDVDSNQGRLAAGRLLGNVVLGMAAFLIVVSLVLVLASPLVTRVLGGGFDSDTLALTRRLHLVMVPVVVLGGLGATVAAALQAQRRFAAAAATQVLNPVITTALFLLLVGGTGIDALAWATVVGFAAEAGLLMMLLGPSRPALRWSGLDGPTRRVIGDFAPLVVAVLISGLNLVVDQAMASSLGPGQVASLGYGTRLIGLALAVGAVSLGTAVLPHFSELVAHRQWAPLRHTLRQQVRVVLAITGLVTVAVIALAEPIVRTLFGGGAFTHADVHQVSQVLALSALQIPAFTVFVLYARVISALGANRLIIGINGMALVANFAGNLVFREIWGVAGIALSTALVYVGSAVAAAVVLRRRLADAAGRDPEARPPQGDALVVAQ